jgi:hypothetical protein
LISRDKATAQIRAVQKIVVVLCTIQLEKSSLRAIVIAILPGQQ